MSHLIPEDAQRLISRLRLLADELESAARYGVPVPSMCSASGHRFSGASFSATPEQFDAWLDYAEAEATLEWEDAGKHWRSAEADVNGLPLGFATSEPISVEVTP